MKIVVSRDVAASTEKVWAELRDISRHVQWMADARSIEFGTTQREGVGVTFTCLTQVGPLRLLDHMTITQWREGEAMGVRHEGLVTGEGLFTLKAVAAGTRVRWEENLRLPWYYGGPLGTLFARFLLRTIWAGNLRRLALLVT
jgi:carbon monoxide dehydrogenase subunit G